MLKKILFCSVLFFHVQFNYSQERLKKYLDAENITTNLNLEITGTKDSTLSYIVDDRDYRSMQKLENNTVFTGRHKNINIFFKFFNPIKYNVEVSSSREKDSSMAKIVASLSSAFDELVTITAGESAKASTAAGHLLISELSTVQDSASKAISAKNQQLLLSIENNSTILKLALMLSINPSIAGKDQKEFETVLDKLAKMDKLFNNTSFISNCKSYYSKLDGATSLKELTEALTESKLNLTTIETDFKNKDSIFYGLVKQLKDFCESKKDNIQRTLLVNSYLKDIISDYETISEKEKEITKNLKSISKRVTEFTQQQWDDTGKYYLLMHAPNIGGSDIVKVKIVVTAFKFDAGKFLITPEKYTAAEFSIIKNKKLIMTPSSGILYAEIGYTQYATSTSTGSLTIEETKKEFSNYHIAFNYNFIPVIKDWDVLPIIQVGIGPSNKTYPLLYYGIAALIPDYNIIFGISAVHTWDRKLTDNYTTGRVIADEKELKDHLGWKFSNVITPGVYLQFNFSHK